MSVFPYQIFFRFFFAQVVLFNASLAVVLGVLNHMGRIPDGDSIKIASPFFILSLLIAAGLSWRFSRPLMLMHQKALRISSKKHMKLWGGEEDEDLFTEDPWGYSELSSVLDRIDKKLKKRKDQLTREREENAAFMTSVREGIISIDPNGKILYFNSQFATLFMAPELVKYEGPVQLAESIRVPEVLEAFRHVIEKGETQRVVTRMPTQLDRQPHDFSISLAPFRNEKSTEIRGVIGVFHDITDLKAAERVRIEFVSNASHELRTPLTSIKGYLDTLVEDYRAGRMDQAGNFLDVISRNLNRLIELVNDLLSLSSLEHNPELKLEPINALMVTDHIVKELSGMASSRGQMIHVSGQVPDFLADLQKVEQVLRNLVGNAIKYAGEGRQIRISWEQNERNQMVLKVSDNGPGVSPEHHARLFERFYRVDKGRSRDAGGTGLGLAIVKHIMQSHGGSVTVQSEPGAGSTFVCYFPNSRNGFRK